MGFRLSILSLALFAALSVTSARSSPKAYVPPVYTPAPVYKPPSPRKDYTAPPVVYVDPTGVDYPR
jgi:hypothetical protein